MIMYILRQKYENSLTPFTVAIDTVEYIENGNKQNLATIPGFFF